MATYKGRRKSEQKQPCPVHCKIICGQSFDRQHTYQGEQHFNCIINAVWLDILIKKKKPHSPLPSLFTPWAVCKVLQVSSIIQCKVHCSLFRTGRAQNGINSSYVTCTGHVTYTGLSDTHGRYFNVSGRPPKTKIIFKKFFYSFLKNYTTSASYFKVIFQLTLSSSVSLM